MTPRFRITSLVACASVLLGASSFAASERVSVVFDQNNLPYSSQNGRPAGLYVEIAHLLAQAMSIELDPRWVDTRYGGLLSLLAEDDPIQLAVGVPIEPNTVEDEERVGEKVLYSEPFACARYVLVTRQNGQELQTFRAIGRARMGVEFGSIASGVLWDKGFLIERKSSQDQILKSLVQGDVVCGVLWNNAGWLIEHDDVYRDALRVHPADPENDRLAWDLAVAISPEHAYLLPKVNAAIQVVLKHNILKPLFEKYAVPFFEPTTGKGNSKP